ncbi:class I SAM-dependent methyltransferase [Clostridium sp. UBA4548]|uniref:class I SAM-dependent methyltransferase n=1 Tax=Clostridium sp. UBA4548 TaxID=1946361 RepID=UPI0025C5A337|nr:class I SAM-dependent methyltransferase [Clostridium sp. UBA4548]
MEYKACRFCGTELKDTFVNLGMSPLSNSYIKYENLKRKENYYPLHAYVCSKCFLVQLEEFESPENIFSDYAYFSSYSNSWLKHVEEYVDMMAKRLKLNTNSTVVEIASNDGYLLQFFKGKNIPVLGIEPAKNVALESEAKGINTIKDFFGLRLAEDLKSNKVEADLLIANNVLAHVPNINDFVAGMKKILKSTGVITIEFPHLLRLIKENQFDTIYHEHYSYLSLITVTRVLEKHGLVIFDVEEVPTHGGSLRIYAKHFEDSAKELNNNVATILNEEIEFGLDDLNTYKAFSKRVENIKRNILSFLIKCKSEGKQIVGYGAPAKGNTLLNYCGIGVDFLDYTVDKSPHKQGLRLPGSHIPIYSPSKIMETKPDYVVILPWNIKEEIVEQMGIIKKWNGKFVTLIPNIEVN